MVSKLNALEGLPDLSAVVDDLFPEDQPNASAVRQLALQALPEVDPGDRDALVTAIAAGLLRRLASRDENAAKKLGRLGMPHQLH